MDAHSRRAAAIGAIDKVLAGKPPDSLEGETVGFEGEVGTVGRTGARGPIPPTHEPAARALAAEATCFANTDAGGVIVVGVDDKQRGPAAFVGAHLATDWPRERIHALTVPHLAVDLIEEMTVAGKRVYLINVAPALEEIRCDGKLRARLGRRCEELTGDQARRFLETRRRYDWSAEPSSIRLSQAVPSALALANRFYRDEHARTPASDRALATQLGLTVDDSEDPTLNNAGALLLCAFDPGQVQIDVIATRVEGRPSRHRLEARAPLLTAFEDAVQMVEASFPAERIVVGMRRRDLRAVPRRAFREALVNAVMHRDYRMIHGRVTVMLIGEPATTLKVRSPGGFPPGVAADRLLTTPSRPRNPALAQALHTLGMSEREGIGIDRMYLEMLRDGHRAPDIVEDAGDVLGILWGGEPDQAVRAFFDGLAAADPELEEDVPAHVAITQLLRATPLRPEVLATAAQCTRPEALATLERLERAGALERLVDRSQSFRLAKPAVDRLRARLAYAPRAPIEEHWEAIRAYLEGHGQIGRDTAAALLGLKPVQASTILSTLYHDEGVIEPVGKPRGRGVRYRLTGTR